MFYLRSSVEYPVIYNLGSNYCWREDSKFIDIVFLLIDFNGMSTHLELFYA